MSEQAGKTTIILLISATLFLAACASPQSEQMLPAVPTETEHLPDMANPAAVYCENLGYDMENVTRDGGQDADCIFPDASRCGQWDFLSGRCGQNFTFCSMQGFKLEPGANIGTCSFPDGSFCDEYQYFLGNCGPGDNPGAGAEEAIQILDVYQARDFLAQYFETEYGIQLLEDWIEQDITQADAVGSFRRRFVSGPMTIVISAEAAAPAPAVFTVEEASYLVNGFYWEGTLSFDGELAPSKVNSPGTILNPEDAREAIMQHIIEIYNLPGYGEWQDQGISHTDSDTAVKIYNSGNWMVEVEWVPAAPLVASYHVTANHLVEEISWEGEISLQGEIAESSFSR